MTSRTSLGTGRVSVHFAIVLMMSAVALAAGCNREIVAERQGVERRTIGGPEMSQTADIGGTDKDAILATAARYLEEVKKWERDSYRLEFRGLSDDDQLVIMWGVYLEDEINPVPGAGKSVELHIDPKELRIVNELGFQ